MNMRTEAFEKSMQTRNLSASSNWGRILILAWRYAQNQEQKLKNLKIVFVLGLVFVIRSSYGQSQPDSLIDRYYSLLDNGGVTEESQNWMKDSIKFDEGIYYDFIGKFEPSTNTTSLMTFLPVSPDMILGFLIANDFQIKEAWFKKGHSNCRGFEVIVPFGLSIRTKSDEQTKELEKFGFKKTLTPSVGDCPYYVRHYVFDY